ncbi:MAG: hypothetical protein WKF59_11290 [Chitinophagaceae bacterium]
MPLTHLNTAMRSVAFEGTNLWDVRNEIGILLLWGVVAYAISIKSVLDRIIIIRKEMLSFF